MFCTAFLLSLLPLLASPSPTTPIDIPDDYNTPVLAAATCGTLHPSWLLSSINIESYYTYQSPSAHAVDVGKISFYFYNNQIDGYGQCEGYSAFDFGVFEGTQYFTCGEVDENGLGTSFSYDSSSFVISVNSTWTCPDGDVVYAMASEVKLDLDCETDEEVNPDWEVDGWYSNTTTTCDPTWAVITI